MLFKLFHFYFLSLFLGSKTFTREKYLEIYKYLIRHRRTYILNNSYVSKIYLVVWCLKNKKRQFSCNNCRPTTTTIGSNEVLPLLPLYHSKWYHLKWLNCVQLRWLWWEINTQKDFGHKLTYLMMDFTILLHTICCRHLDAIHLGLQNCKCRCNLCVYCTWFNSTSNSHQSRSLVAKVWLKYSEHCCGFQESNLA